MTLRFDYFKFEYDDAVPAFVEVDDKHFLHRPTSRFLDRVSLTARWTADGYTPHAKEVGKAAEWLWKHFTIGAPGGGGGGGGNAVSLTANMIDLTKLVGDGGAAPPSNQISFKIDFGAADSVLDAAYKSEFEISVSTSGGAAMVNSGAAEYPAGTNAQVAVELLAAAVEDSILGSSPSWVYAQDGTGWKATGTLPATKALSSPSVTDVYPI